jgi:3-oxoadipate enol-lactonase
MWNGASFSDKFAFTSHSGHFPTAVGQPQRAAQKISSLENTLALSMAQSPDNKLSLPARVSGKNEHGFMAEIEINGVSIHYQIRGEGLETIVFAHGLLWSEQIFENQIAAFQHRYRCISFDFRGQGQTAAPRSGYDIETLYADTTALIEALGAVPCHYVGVSMGGMVGLRIAIRKPELIKSLALFATSADAETEEKKKRYRLLTFIAKLLGLRVVANKVMPVMFGKTFLNDPFRAELKQQWRQNFLANRRIGVARAVIGVMNREPIYEQINKINAPTLVAIGDEDVAISMEQANRIRSRIARSKLAIIPRAGHTPTVEEPAVVNALLEDLFDPNRQSQYRD